MEKSNRNKIIAAAAAAVVLAGGGIFMLVSGGNDAIETAADIDSSSVTETLSSADDTDSSSEDKTSSVDDASSEDETSSVDDTSSEEEPDSTDEKTPTGSIDSEKVEDNRTEEEHQQQLEEAKKDTPKGEEPKKEDKPSGSENKVPSWREEQTQEGKHEGPDGYWYSDNPGGPSSDGSGHFSGVEDSWLPGLTMTNDMGGDLSGFPQQYVKPGRKSNPYSAYAVDFDAKFFEVYGIKVSSWDLYGGSTTQQAINFAKLVGNRFSLPLFNVGAIVDCNNLGDSVPTKAEWDKWINGRKAADIPISEIAAHYRWMNYEYNQGEELYFIFNAMFRPNFTMP